MALLENYFTKALQFTPTWAKCSMSFQQLFYMKNTFSLGIIRKQF